MSSTMNLPSKDIQSKKIQPTITSLYQKEDRLYQPPTIIVKASMKHHTTSSFQSSEINVEAVSHIYMSKNLHK